MSELTNPHDRFFKETFSRIEVARDFFVNYLPERVTAVLNLNTLSLQSGSFVDEELGEQFADLLYQVDLHEAGEAYLYVLLEHKSYPDPQTPFQLLRYLVRIWARDERDGETLRPIIPIVVYHGQKPWQIATDFGELFSGPEILRSYWPTFRYELQDLSMLSDADIRGAVLLQISLLVMKYIFDPALASRLEEIFALFNELAESQTTLEYLRTILYYMSRASAHLEAEEMVETAQRTLTDKRSEMMQTVADQWIEQGFEQGRIQTLQEEILDLLNVRFGLTPSEMEEQVTTVTHIPTLRQLLRRAALADTLAGFTHTLNELTGQNDAA